MSRAQLSENLKIFIFQYIDSVELVDVLALLRANRLNWQNSTRISQELRSSQSSVVGRLNALASIGLAEENSESRGDFRYQPNSPALDKIVDELMEEYRVRRHTILELIFSPAKQARPFADAFVLGKGSEKKGTGDA